MIGSLTLTPAFSSAVTEYTATTQNNSNKVTATATDETATITILNGETPVNNGSNASWEEGENVLTITVSQNGASTVYTVTVTKPAAEQGG